MKRGDEWTVLSIVDDYAVGHSMWVTQLTKEPSVGYPQFDARAAPRRGPALPTAALRRDRDTFS
jgi:hypothetical protein